MTTALVTGASSGIGEAIAEVMASRGHDVVVVARRTERLEALKRRIQAAHAVRVEVLGVDLGREDAAEQVFAATARLGLRIGVLVNNAGYAITGRFREIPWEQQAALIQVLGATPVRLIHRYLPGMLEAGAGRVMNVASVGAFMPGMPGMTLYAGLKQFLLATTDSLATEYRGTGVTFTTLCPGATKTEWAEKSGVAAPYSKIPDWLVQTPRQCAEEACDAMEKGRRLVVTGWSTRLTRRIAPLLPAPFLLAFWNKVLLSESCKS